MKPLKHFFAFFTVVFFIVVNIATAGAADIDNTSQNADTVFGLNPAVIILLACVSLIVIATLFFIIYQQKLNYREKTFELENTDRLTGERNWQYFLNDAEKIIKSCSPENLSIIQINIRNFKYINDVYSSLEGDELLKFLSKIISSHIEKGEIQTRINADNFIVLLKRPDQNGTLKFFNELKFEMHRRVGNDVDDILGDIYCGIYLGETNSPKNISEMCECAAIALRKASENKLSYVFYEEKMRQDVTRESYINKTMYDALRNSEFQFYLQPQHNIKKNDRVSCAEALVRWIKPDGSMIFPNDFISIFERNGFIVELDRFIFEEVCKFINYCLDEEWFQDIRIAVNVSRFDLLKRDFVDYYAQKKEQYKIPDNRIELEFTESVVYEDYETFKYVLKSLKESGFICSLDDFGAGSSSLNVLKELPVDILKMDRMFFTESADAENSDETRNNSLIAGVVAMARGLNMRIVAEGIEDVEQINFLRRIGCDLVQGYVFAKPMPIPDFIDYVKKFETFTSAEIYNIADEHYAEPEENDVLLKQKYSSTLNFVHALVSEIDLDEDRFKIVSSGSGGNIYPAPSGCYSVELENYVRVAVIEEDRKNLLQSFNLQNILSCFYRGDETMVVEYRAKKYNKDLKRFDENYEWHCMTLQRLSVTDNSRMLAMQYVQNIHEKYDNKLKLRDSQNKLLMALQGIKGTVYEVNLLKNKFTLIQDNSHNDAYMVSDGSSLNQLLIFIDKYIHEDDREKLLNICTRFFINEFVSGKDDRIVLEYRKLKDKNNYVWKSVQIIKNPNENNTLLMITQDISDLKTDEEKLVSSEKRLKGLIDNLYINVTEVNLIADTFTLIKSQTPVFDETVDMNYSEMLEYVIKNVAIHPDYAKKLRDMLSKENILFEFKNGNYEFNLDYPVLQGSDYIWHSAAVKRDYVNDSAAIILVTDIDKKKRQKESVESAAF